jgi:SAM-dependent methyltransferase
LIDASLHTLATSLTRQDWCDLVVSGALHGHADPRLPSLPSEEIQTITNNIAGEKTMIPAAQIYTTFADIIARHLTDATTPKIMDFGCGWGRIARFLPQLTPIHNIHGLDVDERLIESCQALLPPMQFEVMVSGERLPFDDASLDVVISNSVFSHLSESSHLFHMREIARILRPGGLFLGTTLAQTTLDAMYTGNTNWITNITGPRAEAEATLAEQGFVYGSTGRWTDYGIAFTNEEWVRQNWAPEFDIVEVVQQAQQINVARRTDV